MDMTKRDVQYHIGLGQGDAGGYCILPGDPGRCERIAALLDNRCFVHSNREFTTWAGTLEAFVGEQCRQILARSVLNPQQPAASPLRQERLLPYFERLCQMELYRRNSQETVGVLLALLGVYQDLAEPQREERKKEDPRIMEALSLIAAGYHRSEFCAETIARKMAVSRTTLNRLFQKKIGRSPGQYLLEYRLQQSEKLLQMGMTVKQTALSCGFEDPFYYSRVFRKHYGMPPLDYRLQFAEIQ